MVSLGWGWILFDGVGKVFDWCVYGSGCWFGVIGVCYLGKFLMW